MKKNVLVRERSLKARFLSALTSVMMLVTTVVPVMDVSAIDEEKASEAEAEAYYPIPVKSVDVNGDSIKGATFEVVDEGNNVVSTFESTGSVDYAKIQIGRAHV